MAQKVDVSTDPALYCLVAAALFIVPWRWVAGWLAASAVHELFHLIAIRICRSRVWQIKIGLKGVLLVTDTLLPVQEAFCAIAGPIGSVICILFSRLFPEASVFGFLQCAYNLLPAYPLDGGRFIKALLECCMRMESVCKVVAILRCTVILALLCAAVYIAIHFRTGFWPVLIVAVIWLKTKKSLH